MAFADDFRAEVVPRLSAEMRFQALQIALDLTGWEDAASTVGAVARKGGSGLLGSDHQERLSDWIDRTLFREEIAAEARIADTEQRIEAAIASDPIAYYDGLAARTSDPARMKWVFAAICPEYRTYLIAAAKSTQTAKSIRRPSAAHPPATHRQPAAPEPEPIHAG